MSSSRSHKQVKGQGSVFCDRRSPYWQIRYWNGRTQVRESARTVNRKDALELLRRRLSEIEQNRTQNHSPEHIRIGVLLNLLIDDYRRQDRADLYQVQLRIKKHLQPAFGELLAFKFSSKHIRDYIEARMGNAANATVNRELAILRRAFRLGSFEDPPLVYRVPRIPSLKEDNIRDGFLEPEQYHSILNELPDSLKPVFVLGYHLGMRMGELLKLKTDWIDLKEGLIYVNGRVTKNRRPKTAPIYGEMREWLSRLISNSPAPRAYGRLLFTWPDERPIKDFRASWKKACCAAGIPNLLFHDLRRTAVRNMIRAGVAEKIAMEISGHKTASMLWRYNIVDSRDIKEAGKLTASYLASAQRCKGGRAA